MKALITGGSSGIGLALAHCFARGGYDLVLVARRQAALEEAARAIGPRARVIAADLADPAARERLARDLPSVDVLVNAAGFGLAGAFAEQDEGRIQELVRLNIEALTGLCRTFLPAMIARRRGGVLNVASTAAYQPGPGMAAYYASKAYVLSFSEALYYEAKPHGVTVTALCPGPTRTAFQEVAGLHGSRMFRNMRVMDADAVARAGYTGLHKQKRVVIPGSLNTLLAHAARIFPSGISAQLAQRLHTSTK